MTKKGSRILVSGSVALDLIFDIHGTLQNEIIVENGKLPEQNMMFVAKRKMERYGGTGGNISYGLGLLGAKPLLFSAAGKDFEFGFRKHLKKVGVDVRVLVDKKGHLANFYGMSDERGQQIGVWQPNAYYDLVEKSSLTDAIPKTELRKVSHAIFSAGTGKSMLKNMEELRTICGKESAIIFDPGQVISIFYNKALFEKSIALADIFIGNEVEFKQMETLLGYSRETLFNLGVSTLIETKGREGSVIYHKDGKQEKIQAVNPAKIVETTGAGDAFRAGLLSGLSRELSLSDSCKLGAKIAAKSIEFAGAQEYRI